MTRPQRKTRKKIILLVVAMALLTIVVLAHENLAEMVRVLGGANYWLVAAAFGVYLLAVLFWATRWRISLSAVGYPRRVRDLCLVILSGIFVTNITPFTYAGGDPIARSYVLNKTQWVPYSSGFATVMAELMLDAPIFISFLMIGLLMCAHGASAHTMLLVAGVGLTVVIVLLSSFSRLLSSRVGADKIKGFAMRVIRAFGGRVKKTKIPRGVESFYAGTHAILGRWRIASLMGCFSVILRVLGMIRLFFIFYALGYLPPIPMLLLAVTLPAIVGLLPLLPGGIGTVDGTLVSVYLLFGVPIEIAVSATLIDRAITFVFGTAIGACVTSYLGMKVRGAKAGEEHMPR